MELLQFYPTVDAFATKANKKVAKYISLDYTDDEKWSEDFFHTSEFVLREELLYLFPPKQVLTKVFAWARFTSAPFIMIFHVFDFWPLGFEFIKNKPNTRIWQLPVDMAYTIFPCEKLLLLNDKVYFGIPNKRAKQTIVVISNVIGPVKINGWY